MEYLKLKTRNNKAQRYNSLQNDGFTLDNNYSLELNQIDFTGQLFEYLY